MEITVEISFEVTAPTPTCAYRSWNSARSSTKHTAPTTPKALSSLSRVRQVTSRRCRRVSTRGTAIDCTDRGGSAPCMRRRCGDAPASALTEPPVDVVPGWLCSARGASVQHGVRTCSAHSRTRHGLGPRCPGAVPGCGLGQVREPVALQAVAGGPFEDGADQEEEEGGKEKGDHHEQGGETGDQTRAFVLQDHRHAGDDAEEAQDGPEPTEAQRRTEVPEEPHHAAEDAQPVTLGVQLVRRAGRAFYVQRRPLGEGHPQRCPVRVQLDLDIEAPGQ